MVVNRVGDVIHYVLDRNLLVLSHGENNRLDLGVLTKNPENELAHIDVVNELAQRLARAPHDHRLSRLLRLVELVDQSGNDVASLDLEVVVRSVDVRGHDGGEVAAVLLGVQTIEHLDHTLRVRISLVRKMGRTVVHHGLVDGIRRLVRENASRQAGNEFLHLRVTEEQWHHLELTAQLHHVHVHDDVVIVKLDLVLHVVEQAADLGSQMDHVIRLILFKTSARSLTVATT